MRLIGLNVAAILLASACVGGPVQETSQLRLGEEGYGTVDNPVPMVLIPSEACPEVGDAISRSDTLDEATLYEGDAWQPPGLDGCLEVAPSLQATGAAGVLPALIYLGVVAAPVAIRLAPELPRMAAFTASAAVAIYVAVRHEDISRSISHAISAIQSWGASSIVAKTDDVEGVVDRTVADLTRRAPQLRCEDLAFALPTSTPGRAVPLGLNTAFKGLWFDTLQYFELATLSFCQSGAAIYSSPPAIQAAPGAILIVILVNRGELPIQVSVPGSGVTGVAPRSLSLAVMTVPMTTTPITIATGLAPALPVPVIPTLTMQ